MAAPLFDMTRQVPTMVSPPDRLPDGWLLGAGLLLAAALTGCASLPPPSVAGRNPGLIATAPLLEGSPETRTPARRTRQPAPQPHPWDESASLMGRPAPDAQRGFPDPARILQGLDNPAVTESIESDSSPNAELASYALGYLGTRYRMGGSSPDTGFDCSGLVGYVTRQVLGLNLPRRAEEISRMGADVKLAELEPGDLVFYNTLRRKYSHVGIYLGDGRFVHSPSAGGVVRIENMSMAYWKNRFNGARRIAGAEASER